MVKPQSEYLILFGAEDWLVNKTTHHDPQQVEGWEVLKAVSIRLNISIYFLTVINNSFSQFSYPGFELWRMSNYM